MEIFKAKKKEERRRNNNNERMKKRRVGERCERQTRNLAPKRYRLMGALLAPEGLGVMAMRL